MSSNSYCGQCGKQAPVPHPACADAAALSPPRYCAQCGRRMKVQVTPTGWTAECVEHGSTSDDAH